MKQNVFTKFTLNGDEIPVKREYRYLGHTLCDTLSDNVDIERQCKSLYIQGNIIIRKFRMCTEDVKIKLFQSYCSALLCGGILAKLL